MIRVISIITEVEVGAKVEVHSEVEITIGVRIIDIPHMRQTGGKRTEKIKQSKFRMTEAAIHVYKRTPHKSNEFKTPLREYMEIWMYRIRENTISENKFRERATTLH